MGQHFTKTESIFLSDCEKQLCQLDEMLLGTVWSAKSLKLSFDQLLHQLDVICKENTDGNELKQSHKKSIELCKEILSSLENGLSHQNTVLLQEISQFARMIKTKSDKSKPITASIPRLKDMKIDVYLSSGKIPNVCADTSKPPEKTKERNSVGASAARSNKEADRTIADLKEDKIKFLKEIKELQEEDKKNKEKVDELERNVDKLRDENQRLLKEKADLEDKVKTFQRESVQIVPVQLYYQKRNDQMGFVVQEILAQLNVKDRFGNKQLAFITCDKSSDIQPGLPLLILCINASRIGTDATNSIQGISKLGNSALVVLHHKDEHALPEHSSERVLAEPEFKALGGIFDIAYLSAKGIYTCDRNADAITGLVKFITKVLEENPMKVQIM